ncbi:MAG: hypothetical protein ABJG41_19920 [Cyclobacteriaceae bacterium]
MQRISFLFLVLALTSCYDTGLDSMDIASEYDVVYLNNLSDPSSFSNDPYKIIAVTPRGDEWNAIVEYPGGCGEHVFYLWWSGSVLSSNPSQLELYLIHNGNGDACEAVVRDTVTFSLTEAINGAELDDDTRINVFNQTRAQVVEVDPFIASLTSDECNLEATITRDNCELGPLGGIWIKPNLKIEGYEDLLLQPVRVVQDSSQVNLTSKEVDVAVTVLFGFEYVEEAELDSFCPDWPDNVISVAVNCIKPR